MTDLLASLSGPRMVITIATKRPLPCDGDQLLAKCVEALEKLVDEFDLPIVAIGSGWRE